MNDQLSQKNQLLAFAFLAALYGMICLVLLFGYLEELSKNPERILAACAFGIGGLCALYALLLSAASKTQDEPQKSKTVSNLRVVSWAGTAIMAILLLLILSNAIFKFPFTK